MANVADATDTQTYVRRFDTLTNDLTQLVLGVGRDEQRRASLFDERDASVKQMIVDLIGRAHGAERPVGICGQAPSDRPDFAEFLVEAGIDSISVIPDSVADVIRHVAQAEKGVQRDET